MKVSIAKSLTDLFASEGIASYGTIPFSDCRVTNERALKRLFKDRLPKSVVMAAVPYYTKADRKNISVYAFSRDYHLYFKHLKECLAAVLPEESFVICGDDSPIDERLAAESCGVGFVGDNGVLINETLGSFFFLVGVYFFEETEPVSLNTTLLKECLHCGRCLSSCPTGALKDMDYTRCLSAVTQKKKISDDERELIARMKSVWGCDICQEVCPYNENISETRVDFFLKDRITYLDTLVLDRLVSDNSFSERAFAWRGEATVRRNTEIMKGEK